MNQNDSSKPADATPRQDTRAPRPFARYARGLAMQRQCSRRARGGSEGPTLSYAEVRRVLDELRRERQSGGPAGASGDMQRALG